MNFDVPYEDMVCGARSGSSSGRRMSSGRGSSVAPDMLGLVYVSSTYGSNFWSFFYASSSDSRLGSVYTSSSYSSKLISIYASSFYSSKIKCFRTSSFFGRCIYSARGRGCCQSIGRGRDKIEPVQASQFITRSIHAHFPGPIHRFNDFPMDIQELLYHMFMEKELKRPLTFQEVFDKTYKKKGTDQYISSRAREVVESYSQQMTEKYAREEE
ncbi:hypothetical protein Taro_024467 [Colocasia esculenta]|uniref:Uncharacterized protein n=1 Tax=Colocasia esculenta TaxID=4460 RepID=A0A843V6E3_COLES|nr:hypothetical protein [Colocasia esculenta]